MPAYCLPVYSTSAFSDMIQCGIQMLHEYCAVQTQIPVLLGNWLHHTVVSLKERMFRQIRRELVDLLSMDCVHAASDKFWKHPHGDR